MTRGYRRPTASRGRVRTDRGAASVWVLACSTLVLVIGIAVSLRTSAVLARHRAESAADLAALAAAARIGLADDVCAAAAPIARANGAVLVRCRAAPAADGRSGTVDVQVSVEVRLPVVGARLATASARAGRLPSDVQPTAGKFPNRSAIADTSSASSFGLNWKGRSVRRMWHDESR